MFVTKGNNVASTVAHTQRNLSRVIIRRMDPRSSSVISICGGMLSSNRRAPKGKKEGYYIKNLLIAYL